MAQEDVAALLNNMAPDDRTMFLEELPATATRAAARAADAGGARRRGHAARLSGGLDRASDDAATTSRSARTGPSSEVLDYIRAHGQDSETLNVIYVVDEQRRADRRHPHPRVPADRRRRSRVADLMDRRFVALKATDDQADRGRGVPPARPHRRCR